MLGRLHAKRKCKRNCGGRWGHCRRRRVDFWASDGVVQYVRRIAAVGDQRLNFSALAAAIAWLGPVGRVGAQILINEHAARLAIRSALVRLGVAEEPALIAAGVIRVAQAAIAGVIAAEAALGAYLLLNVRR